ncbi:MAG: hypothetical protein PUC46_08135 [Lachnospiraceae bacterium]|nr:hypothetical protein [Lachnospiraceae bacterium]
MKAHLTVRDIAVLGMMTAMLEVVKFALQAIPNVEMVTFLFIIFTLLYGWKVLLCAFAFTALETVWWGPQAWVIMYLYVWPALILITYAVRRHAGVLFYSFLSGFFGLSFGALCSIVYLFIGGPYLMFTWWVSGIPYDIAHGISNFFICLLLYRPFMYAGMKIKASFFHPYSE